MRFQDLFHSPHRGAFHPSLAVLFRYRSLQVLRLGGWSPLLPTAFHDSRRTRARLAESDTLPPTGLSPSPVPPSSRLLLTMPCHPCTACGRCPTRRTTPPERRPQPTSILPVSASSPFARHYLGSLSLSLGY